MTFKMRLRELVDDFRDKHEERLKTFRIKDIPFERIVQDDVTKEQIKALLMAMLVESFIPVFSEYLLRLNRFRMPLDEFTIMWAREEYSHYTALRKALLALGMRETELEARVARVRSTQNWSEVPMREGPFGPLKTSIYPLTNTVIQEKTTEIFYRALSKQIQDPVVTNILKCLATDEARHHQFMLEALKAHLEDDPRGWMASARALIDYEMPGIYLLENWQTLSPESTVTAGVDQEAAFRQIKQELLSLFGWKLYPVGAVMLARQKLVKPKKIVYSTEITRDKR